MQGDVLGYSTQRMESGEQTLIEVGGLQPGTYRIVAGVLDGGAYTIDDVQDFTLGTSGLGAWTIPLIILALIAIGIILLKFATKHES